MASESIYRVSTLLEPAIAGAAGQMSGTPTENSERLLMTSGSSGKRTVEAERRRKPTTPASQRETAATPQRQTGGSASSGGGAASSGGGGGSLRPGLPRGMSGGRGPLSIVGLLLMLVVACVYFGMQFFGGGSDQGEPAPDQSVQEQPLFEQQQPSQEPAVQPEAPEEQPAFAAGQLAGLPTAAPFESQVDQAETQAEPAEAASTKEGQTWLVMLYQDADDKILEQDIYVDLNEAERSGSSERVKLVAQFDRFSGAYSGDGDWTDTRRYLITQDDNLQRVRSQQIGELGEANMADGQTLVDFATWAIENYPADKVVLILSDHGMGWPGGWSDPTARGRDDSRAPLAARLEDHLYLDEIERALAEIRQKSGLEKFELVGMDACLMGQLEVFSALAPHARYAVASQEVEPALGWAYTGFLDELNRNPDMSGADLSRLIVESYIEEDQRIVDRSARAEFLNQNSPMGGLFGPAGDIPAQQLARQIGQSSTLSAIDLGQMPQLMAQFNTLALALQDASQNAPAKARNFAQSFTSIFGKDLPPSYIDLGHFLQLVKENTRSTQITQASDDLLRAIDQAVITEKHGPKKPAASGIAIYFPNSQLYQSPVTGPESYTAIAERFASESLWDDFLAFHYTGQSFEAETTAPAVPPDSATVRAPGLGQISISAVQASATSAAPGQPVTLSADISGENIGYIYLFAGYYDEQARSLYIADSDYLESSLTRELDGIYYPDWGEGDFTLTFDWEPVVFAISDGVNTVPALFEPQTYGQSFEEAVYTVDGTYTYAQDNEQRSARLYFVNGILRNVLGFTGEDGNGAPREIIPNPGDTFTVSETWLDLDESGGVAQSASQPGGTLTFGNQMFTWVDLNAAPGQYVVGFIVEDLDGNRTQSFTQIEVN